MIRWTSSCSSRQDGISKSNRRNPQIRFESCCFGNFCLQFINSTCISDSVFRYGNLNYKLAELHLLKMYSLIPFFTFFQFDNIAPTIVRPPTRENVEKLSSIEPMSMEVSFFFSAIGLHQGLLFGLTLICPDNLIMLKIIIITLFQRLYTS